MKPITPTSSPEIVLIFHIGSTETKNFPKKAIVMLMQDATQQMGVDLDLDIKTSSLGIRCKNLQVYKEFFELACIKLPLSSPPTEKPFEIQFTFNHIPSSIKEKYLISYLKERFHVMNLGLNPIVGSGVYKIIFPSEEMYKMAVVGMLERFYQVTMT